MIKKNYDILKRVSEFEIGQDRMIAELNSDPKLVEEYIKFSLTNHKFAWRATWLLSHYSKNNTETLQKYVDIFIHTTKTIKKDGHIRETLKIIYNLKLNEKQTSDIFDICMNLLEDNRKQPSVRMIAFNFLMRVAKDYPELSSEIEIIIENIKDYLSPGIKNSMTQRINKIKQITK